MGKSWMLMGLVAGALALSACASHEVKAPATAANVSSEQALTPPQQQAIEQAKADTGGGNVSIDETILQLCPNVKPPHFAFDSSKVRTRFEDTMTDLADCMEHGALQGKRVLLVGRADPRGTEDYNLALGGRRAGSVQEALESLGVSSSQLDTSSRGALDATGTNRVGWAKDRRVDIKLEQHSS